MPFRVIPDRGQVSANGAHPVSKQRCHVLHDCVSRSYQANGSQKVFPESRTGAGKPGAESCERNILAREAADHDIGFAFGKFARCDVIMAGDIWPVLGEDASAVGIDFAESDGSHSGSFEAETESADAGKEVEDIH